jgi:hypothetical protein
MQTTRRLTPAGLSIAVWLTLTSLGVAQSSESVLRPIQFEDVARKAGLIPAANNIQAHGAGWGDVDNDGWPDLYVATFHYQGTGPNVLLKNHGGAFQADSQPSLAISTRATGVVFADFDNDGDLDLYVASMPAAADSKLAQRQGHPLVGCSLFENQDGKFRNISPGNASCPTEFGGRSATVLDYDGDGRLDLLVGEDPSPGYNGSSTRRARMFRNAGNLQFEDVTDRVGIPEDAAGLGVAAGDVNQDTWPDIFLVSTLGNHLLINDRQGRFVPFHDPSVFAWPDAKGDNMVCGIAIGDVNNDLWPDIVIGQHYDHPWKEPVANRLYLNRGKADGRLAFEDVTEAAGLMPLPLKAPHVEIQDFNNDGHMDILASIATFADGVPHPVIFSGLGNDQGIPTFRQTAIGINDFPNESDRNAKGSRGFFDKMLKERKVTYAAPAPTCDFDRDGKLDLFFGSWWADVPSMLLRNTTPGGHWIEVEVEGSGPLNRMGIGTRVDLFLAGRADDPAALIGSREIATGFGYASSQQAIAHFGLPQNSPVDVVVTLPHERGRRLIEAIQPNQRHTIQVNAQEHP